MFLFVMLLLAQAKPQTSSIVDRYVEAQRALTANPKSEARLVALASILYESAQNEAAIALVQPFVKSNPRASRAKLFLALGYARQEKYEQARSLAAQVATEFPADYYAHHIWGLSLAGLNEFDKAAAQFAKAIALKPDFADSHYELGVLHSRKPDALENAVREFQRAIEIGYKHAEIYKNLASTSIKLGKYDDAVGYANQALDLNPDYADAYFQLADALRKSAKPDQAAAAMERFQNLNAAAIDSKQRVMKSQAAYEQGMSLLTKDDLSGAYTAFKSAAEISPGLDAAHYRIAQLDYLRNDNKKAVDSIRRALALNPLEAEYYFVLARCIEGTDAAGATDAIRKAVALNPRVADFHNLLGNLLEKTGDRNAAVQSYRKAIALDPNNEAYRANLSAAQRKAPQENR